MAVYDQRYAMSMLKLGMKFSTLFIGILFFTLPAKALDIAGNPIGCTSGNSKFLLVDFHGKVLLNKAFLPDSPTQNSALIQDAIELQIKHLIGYFRNTSESGLNAAISAHRGNLKISPAQEVKYGTAFGIDNYIPADRGFSSASYTQAALKRGEVKPEDAALLIPYSQELMIADCSKSGFQNTVSIELPLDPYLSFWIENKKSRRPRRFFDNSVPEMSNCLSSEFAKFGNSDSNWFFWSPITPKVDPAGKQARCKIDEPSRVYQPELASAHEADPMPTLDRTFFGNLKTFKSSAFFGIISLDPYFAKTDVPKLKASILSIAQTCQKSPSIPECLTHWDRLLTKDPKLPYEPGAFHFLTFLKYLHTLLSVSSLSIQDTAGPNDEIALHYQGHFLDSQMLVSGTVYLGTTTLDYGPRASKAYVKLLHSAFLDSNAIFYVGHAGLGQNFKIDNFEKLWREDHLPTIQRDQPIWVGIYNCEGFSYFGFDQERLFKKGRVNLLLTESSGTEAGAKFPLAQLSILNRVFSNQTVDIKNTMAMYVQSREFAAEMRLKAQ